MLSFPRSRFGAPYQPQENLSRTNSNDVLNFVNKIYKNVFSLSFLSRKDLISLHCCWAYTLFYILICSFVVLKKLRLLIFWETAEANGSTSSLSVKMQLRRHSDYKLKLKGQCGVNLDIIKFGQKQGLWLRRNFVKSPSNPVKVSFHLKELLGDEMFYSRGGIVNQVWNYIQEKRLANPLDKNLIEPDLKLSKVLRKRCLKINRSQILAAINISISK